MSTQIKEHPIIFSGSMIRAILDGSKSQTRRVISPQPVDEDECGPYIQVPEVTDWGCGETLTFMGRKHIKCPYGVPGDTLWVRETARVVGAFVPSVENILLEYRADGGLARPRWLNTVAQTRWLVRNHEGRWMPSIHMPRWASRISLTVKDVRVERVQDITADDCINEGIEAVTQDAYEYDCDGAPNNKYQVLDEDAMLESFQELWDSINGKRGYGWASNPWVWVVEFERDG